MHLRSLFGSTLLHAVAVTGVAVGVTGFALQARQPALVRVLPSEPALATQARIRPIESFEIEPTPELVEELPDLPLIVEPFEEPPLPDPAIDDPEPRPEPELEERVRATPAAATTEAAAVGSEAASLVKAEPLDSQNQPPPYPALAQRRGWEGLVWLEVEVDDEGGVKSVRIAESSGYALLDRSARDAVLGWRFAAAHRSGSSIASVLRLPIEFRLE